MGGMITAWILELGKSGLQSRLDQPTLRVWAYCWSLPFPHSHFHVYKMVTNISLETCWVSTPRQTREVLRHYQAHCKRLISPGCCSRSPLFWKARCQGKGKHRHYKNNAFRGRGGQQLPRLLPC